MNRIDDLTGVQPELKKHLKEAGSYALPNGTPVNAVASTGLLTIGAQPTAGDTLTIGDITYTFIANGETIADGKIEIGTDLATTKVNILGAIDGSDGTNTENEDVVASAFDTDDSTLTAVVKGIIGDTLTLESDFTSGSNLVVAFDNGVDGTLGVKNAVVVDSTNIYICTADNETYDTNWKKVALTSL